MRHQHYALFALLSLVIAGPVGAQSQADLATQVREAERAFAATLASRDFAAFALYVADEAVFFDGQSATRGKTAVVESWKPLFQGASAPFSWEPGVVEVLDSGTLALSSGPVFNPEGKQVGTFSSVWRLEPDGRWRVIFDKGCQVCACARTP
jgi:ketosteroid isomerase-like protein